ncbi:hypothetical protein BJX70DRAFT_378699 [Aspergillus crustosus]
MPLTIHLATTQPTYHGGESLTGIVSFTTTTPIPLHQIHISFTAISKTRVQKVKGAGAPAANYRSSVTLFEKDKLLLYQNGDVLAPGEYEWPFDFVFPENVSLIGEEKAGTGKWAALAPFRVDEGHPLPPSFSIQSGDAVRKVHCVVEYRLEARVLKPQGGLFGSKAPLFSESILLDFLSSLSISNTGGVDPYTTIYRQNKEQLFTIKSMLLLPENRGRSLGFGEKVSSWFSTRLPRFSFQVNFSYPTSLVQFAPFPCHFDVEGFMEDSNVTQVPEIQLRSLSIAVISRTVARAVPTLVGAMSAELDERIEVLNRTGLSMPVFGRVDISQVFGPLIIRKTDVSFSTLNICRSYRLSLAAVFECAGKTNEFKYEDMPIEIIAAGEGNVMDKTEQGVVEVDRRDELPPVYTPDSTSPVATWEKS